MGHSVWEWSLCLSLTLHALLKWTGFGDGGGAVVDAATSFPTDCGTCPAGYCINIESRVVTKKTATKGQVPWQVRVKRPGGELCGATIINENWVVSAAHCMHQEDVDKPGEHEITAGDFDKKTDEGTEQTYSATHVIPHPQFNESGKLFINDIGLIRLNTTITFDQNIKPICYPSKDDEFDKDDKCVVSGWGSYIQDDPQSSNVLRYQTLEIWDNKECNESDKSYSQGQIWTGMFCAGFRKTKNEDIEKCTTLGSGDSGGPFACKSKDSDTWKLAGIVSSSGFCQEDSYTPGQFTKAADFLSWIEETMQAKDSDSKKLADRSNGRANRTLHDRVHLNEIQERAQRFKESRRNRMRQKHGPHSGVYHAPKHQLRKDKSRRAYLKDRNMKSRLHHRKSKLKVVSPAIHPPMGQS